MIPGFDSDGKLPLGIHAVAWEEFEIRFGITESRRRILRGMKAALLVLRDAGCKAVYMDGSFVTSKEVPNDFDGCWERTGVDLHQLRSLDPVLLDFTNKRAAQKAKYLGELFPSEARANTAGSTFLTFFQSDRDGNPKGIVKLELRSL